MLFRTTNLMPDANEGAKKLMPTYSGPYRMTQSINGFPFRLDLPHAVLDRNVHNAFHASLLRPYRSVPYDRLPPAPRPIDFPDGAIEYKFESILRSRKRLGRVQSLVKWRDHDKSESTWQSKADLKNSEDDLATFLRSEAKRGESVWHWPSTPRGCLLSTYLPHFTRCQTSLSA